MPIQPSASDSHALNIFGTLPTGPFASETHNANDQTVFPQVGQYGSIDFTDGQGTFTSLRASNYTGLQPITDTTPAVNYTFNDFGYPDQSFSATTGPIVGGFQTLEFANTPTPPSPTQLRDDRYRQQELRDVQHAARDPSVPGLGVDRHGQRPDPLDRTAEPHVQHAHRRQ